VLAILYHNRCFSSSYGKQKHLRCKKVAWPRKTVTKRDDMSQSVAKINNAPEMKRYKADQKQYIHNQQINLRN